MIDFRYEPPLPDPVPPAGFTQVIKMHDGPELLGYVRWHCPAYSCEAAVQILDLLVNEKFRRSGNGKRLLDMAVAQARESLNRRSFKIRCLWIAIEQKEQVVARAFLTSAGFHYLNAIKGICEDQDFMIYLKSLD